MNPCNAPFDFFSEEKCDLDKCVTLVAAGSITEVPTVSLDGRNNLTKLILRDNEIRSNLN